MRIHRFAKQHKGFYHPDPYASRTSRIATYMDAFLSITIFRCWHILLFFAIWSSVISVINYYEEYELYFKPTMLIVIGTTIGFVTSTRTSISFDRYNEGRKLWAQIIHSSRMLGRTVWYHIPEPEDEEMKSRMLIEKKSILNLLEAFAVSTKHYLRGEDGIYYEDLYYLVKFLPAFSHQVGAVEELIEDAKSPGLTTPVTPHINITSPSFDSGPRSARFTASSPAASPAPRPLSSFVPRNPVTPRDNRRAGPIQRLRLGRMKRESDQIILSKQDEAFLLSARHPPNWGLMDIFPFSLIRRALIKRSKGRTARSKMRAKLRSRTATHHLPLEITLYLSSYIAANQRRLSCDAATYNQLFSLVTSLVNCLTSLERIVTTPIPFSYSVHLWIVISIYVLLLPFQIWDTMKWLTIPGTVIAAFFFFGFLVAGEELENPFGYDKNDLDLDHFTHIIRNELKAITTAPAPDPEDWMFAQENDLLFAPTTDKRTSPEEWMNIGHENIQHSLISMQRPDMHL